MCACTTGIRAVCVDKRGRKKMNHIHDDTHSSRETKNKAPYSRTIRYEEPFFAWKTNNKRLAHLIIKPTRACTGGGGGTCDPWLVLKVAESWLFLKVGE